MTFDTQIWEGLTNLILSTHKKALKKFQIQNHDKYPGKIDIAEHIQCNSLTEQEDGKKYIYIV